MAGMKTAGIIRKTDTVWEVATPMGVVAALVPSTNPTATAMYKAILAAKARCAVVMSPHPRAARCTAEATRIVAEAAVAAGAPEGLFHCLTNVSLAATDALMKHPLTRVILATGGGPMVRAAYSKGKPAYGVGSGNVPAYVDRSANVAKAAADILTGTAFDWGTLCSTERSVVADSPVGPSCWTRSARAAATCARPRNGQAARDHQARRRLQHQDRRAEPVPHRGDGRLLGARHAQALIAEVDTVGKAEPISMETLSPILSFYTADGWEAGCERCLEILHFGGVGHTLALHATADRVIEQFALYKPAMRIVVNTVAALGSVGFTTDLFPAMTLGPGAVGGSITSDNVGPMHLVDVKRIAFEAHPLNDADGNPVGAQGARAGTGGSTGAQASRAQSGGMAPAGARAVRATEAQPAPARPAPGRPAPVAEPVSWIGPDRGEPARACPKRRTADCDGRAAGCAAGSSARGIDCRVGQRARDRCVRRGETALSDSRIAALIREHRH